MVLKYWLRPTVINIQPRSRQSENFQVRSNLYLWDSDFLLTLDEKTWMDALPTCRIPVL
jgi:hypothetical protein